MLLHRSLHVLLHLRSWMGWWGWQHRIVMLCAAPTLQHRVVLLEVEELPTISEKMRRLFLVIDWINVGVQVARCINLFCRRKVGHPRHPIHRLLPIVAGASSPVIFPWVPMIIAAVVSPSIVFVVSSFGVACCYVLDVIASIVPSLFTAIYSVIPPLA